MRYQEKKHEDSAGKISLWKGISMVKRTRVTLFCEVSSQLLLSNFPIYKQSRGHFLPNIIGVSIPPPNKFKAKLSQGLPFSVSMQSILI